METADSLASKRRLTRSSLACLPCRSRHIKCDGQRPRCTRCVETSKECDYTESRRGGLDRAALAERRRKLTAAEAGYPPSPPRSTGLQQDHNGLDLSEDVDIGIEWVSEVTPPLSIDYNIPNPGTLDPLVESYYKNFHKFHPVAPPRKHLIRLCQDMVRANQLNPLIQVLRFIGHIYSYREWSTPLRSSLEASFTQVLDKDPIMVLCRLLYSIPLFWFGYNAEAKQQMDMASALALELGMYQQGFAPHHGSGDPVLAEMWRRTWWLLYVVDCSYAGTLGTRIFAFQHVKHTADLPCEDHEYESGDIPEPRTLEDFDSREFSFDETVFSSFAYLIGAVRCGISAMTSLPKFVTKEDSEQLIQKFDSTADAWLLLLPKSKQVVMSKTGEIDEIMFQAHLILHVATIGLHRPLSDLKFNAVEDISSCAREPPPDTPTPDLVNVHTVRILRAVEAQIRLLALPVRPFHHSPFTTCTVSEGTLALLSACNYLLKGRDLEVARDQIRLQIGCLKALAELWPRTARNVKEIQIIARHVLKLEYKNDGTSSESSSSNQGSSLLRGSTGVCDQDGPPSGNIFANADLMDGSCGWYGTGTLGPDGGISNWWMNE